MLGLFQGMRRPTLRMTLIAILVLVCLPNVVVVVATLLHAGRSFRDISENRLMETARILSQSTESELYATERMLAFTLGTDRALVPAPNGAIRRSDGPDLAPLGRGKASEIKLYELPLSPTDQELADYGLDRVLIPLAQKALAEGLPQVSNILPTTYPEDTPRLGVAVPTRSDDNEWRLALMVVDPSFLIQSLARKGLDGDAKVILAITDGDGHIIGRSVDGEKFIGRKVPDWDRLKSFGDDSGILRAQTMEGAGVVFAFTSIAGTPGWVAVVGEPTFSFDQRWQQPIRNMVIVSTTTLLLGLLVALSLAARVLRPVRQLVARARRVASGNTSALAMQGPTPRALVAEFEDLRQSLDEAQDFTSARLRESQDAEALARESLARLEQAERLAKIGSWSWEPGSDLVELSRTMQEFCGLSEGQSSVTHTEFLRFFLPEDHRQIARAHQRCGELGEEFGMQLRFLPPSRPAIMTWLRGDAIRDADGAILSVFGSVQDIQERVEQSARLAALADNLPSGAIFRLERRPGQDLKITYMSAGLEPMLGRSRASVLDDPLGFMGILHPEDAPRVFAALNTSSDAALILDQEFRICTAGGRAIWVRGRAALRMQPDGAMVWDGLLLDISAERQTLDALRSAMAAAEQAERAKSDFLATMSHEIRTPMNAVIGMTRLALLQNPDGKILDYLTKISGSAEVLLGIINDILDFSKIAAGELDLECALFRMDGVLETLSTITSLRAEEKGLELAFGVAPEVPQFLQGDALRLGQILTNLVGNAVKFTASGDITLSIARLPSTQDGSLRLQFSVRDTGIGMTPEQISGLFRPFAQAQAETARIYGGTGLGLAISRSLVELMGGKIWVESALGQGSTFHFTAEFGLPGEGEIGQAPLRPALHGLHHRRVLVIDDSAAARDTLTEMLRGFGLYAESVGSGEEALGLLRGQALAGTPFELVMVDWRMPVMDGIDVARHIRTDSLLRDLTAILMVTAYGQQLTMTEIDDIGFQGVLTKPVTQSVVFNSLLEQLAGGQSQAMRLSQVQNRSDIAQMRLALSGRRVLVVDDNALNREVATDFLELAGVQVDLAVNGRDAIDQMQAKEFDAVLMDVHMPVMDGLTAIAEIRSHPKWTDLPVIALTAQARLEDVEESLQAGMTAHLSKPIDEWLMFRTLMKCLDGRPNPSQSVPPVSHTPAASEQRLLSPRVADLLDALLARFGGSEPRVTKFIHSFLREFGPLQAAVAASIGSTDSVAIADLVHKVKGLVGYLEAKDLVQLCDQLESALREGDLAPYVQKHDALSALMRACFDQSQALKLALEPVD